MHAVETQTMWLFRLGTQYYSAGRFAAFSGIFPVCGNLLHHAVEMYLKGALSPSHDLAQLKKLGHSLPSIWRRTMEVVGTNELQRFEAAISRLDPFERLRYPDAVMAEGAVMRLTRNNEDWLPLPEQPHPSGPIYDLIIEEVDELVHVLFTLAKQNPSFYLGELRAEAVGALTSGNLHSIEA